MEQRNKRLFILVSQLFRISNYTSERRENSIMSSEFLRSKGYQKKENTSGWLGHNLLSWGNLFKELIIFSEKIWRGSRTTHLKFYSKFKSIIFNTFCNLHIEDLRTWYNQFRERKKNHPRIYHKNWLLRSHLLLCYFCSPDEVRN